MENIKTSVQFSKKLVDQGTEEEIISSQKMMLDNANNLLAKREEYFKAPVPVAKLNYTATVDEERIFKQVLRKLENSLGEVIEESNDKGKPSLAQQLVRFYERSCTFDSNIGIKEF